MLTKKMTILEIVEEYPETEKLISEYDLLAGVCILCECLFDTIMDIEIVKNIDLSEMLVKLNEIIKK